MLQLLTAGADEVGTAAAVCGGGARLTLLTAPPILNTHTHSSYINHSIYTRRLKTKTH